MAVASYIDVHVLRILPSPAPVTPSNVANRSFNGKYLRRGQSRPTSTYTFWESVPVANRPSTSTFWELFVRNSPVDPQGHYPRISKVAGRYIVSCLREGILSGRYCISQTVKVAVISFSILFRYWAVPWFKISSKPSGGAIAIVSPAMRFVHMIKRKYFRKVGIVTSTLHGRFNIKCFWTFLSKVTEGLIFHVSELAIMSVGTTGPHDGAPAVHPGQLVKNN